MEEKVTPAEINRLREAAEKERVLHHQIMSRIYKISSVRIGKEYLSEGLPPEEQMQIIKRGNQKEIYALLVAYSQLKVCSYDEERFARAQLCEEAQLYIYDKQIGYDAIRNYMLENIRPCLALEKKMILCQKRGKYRFSEAAELFLLEQIFSECSKDKLDGLKSYIEKNKLHPEAENNLIKLGLFVKGSDRIIDESRKLVAHYIMQYKQLCPKAEQSLIESGDNGLILDYIRFSKDGLKNQTAVDMLLERANRAEVVAYFKRYAEL